VPQYDIEIDQGVCVGDGTCQMEAPATFDVSLEGTAFVRNSDGDDAGCVLSAAKKWAPQQNLWAAGGSGSFPRV